MTTLRAKLNCSAVLLVVAPDPEVAAWARQPIELGHPGFRLMPVVIGFDDVPWVRDRAAALRLPELSDAVIAAIEAVSDQRVLTELVTSLGQVRSASDAHAVLDRALAR